MTDTAAFVKSLIKDLNKDAGYRVAYNLETDDAPTLVKRWISTGSLGLDYIISNRRPGGIPEGRIVEIFGPPAIGKSHISLQICKSVQRMGGLVVYIDTENATNIELLGQLGVDISQRFVYSDERCTERIFALIERVITKAKTLEDKDIPIVVIWDSIAASSPKAELYGEYEQDTIGLQARALAKGFRKITGLVGAERVTLVCVNQMKTKIGVLYGDPSTTPGGQAIPFHASVRIKLTSGTIIRDSGNTPCGIKVIATTVKNKVNAPWRKCEFNIMFGQGIDESDYLLNILHKMGEVELPSGEKVTCGGKSAWKVFQVRDAKGNVVHEKKFTRNKFKELVFDDPTYGEYVLQMLDIAFTTRPDTETPQSTVTASDIGGEDAA